MGTVELGSLLLLDTQEHKRRSWLKLAVFKRQYGSLKPDRTFGETLEKKLDRRVDDLCPHHRQTVSLMAWKHLAPAQTNSHGADN